MPTIKYADILFTLRSIVRELNKVIKDNQRTKDASVEHMLNLLRANQVTEKRFCRPEDHYKYFANTYLSYLKSRRLQDEITNKYFNKKDRSIESSANIVGLKLPKQFSE